MINLRKIKNVTELKMGMVTLSVDHGGYESLEKIACIDLGVIYTVGLHDKGESVGENLSTYLDDYLAVYEVVNE